MKKLIILICIVLSTVNLFAQQESAFSQYMFNSLMLNPAYAGSNDYISVNVLGRYQWVNYPGSPKTHTLSFDYKVPSENMGLGLTFESDNIGVTQTNEIGAIYSYFVQTGQKTRLSFGLEASIMNYSDKVTDLTVWDEDSEFQANETKWFPKFGFGLYFYSKNYYLGFSIPTLYVYDKQYDFNYDIHESSFFRRHLYFSAGYVLELNDNYTIKPFTLVKYSPSVPLQLDINIAAVYKDVFWLGAGYRLNNSVMAMLAIQLNDNIRLGYSYDVMNFSLFNNTYGAHEIQLGIDFGGSLKRIKSVRYF